MDILDPHLARENEVRCFLCIVVPSFPNVSYRTSQWVSQTSYKCPLFKLGLLATWLPDFLTSLWCHHTTHPRLSQLAKASNSLNSWWNSQVSSQWYPWFIGSPWFHIGGFLKCWIPSHHSFFFFKPKQLGWFLGYHDLEWTPPHYIAGEMPPFFLLSDLVPLPGPWHAHSLVCNMESSRGRRQTPLEWWNAASIGCGVV